MSYLSKICLALALPILMVPAVGFAADKTVIKTQVRQLSAEGVGEEIGTISLHDTAGGLAFDVDVAHLSPGQHGFHVHEKANCGPAEKDGVMVAGLAAGGHFDPDKTGKHMGPAGNGHKGDMPFLTADASGHAKETLKAPHLKLADVVGHAIIIHAGGDNYSDEPKPLGGGGSRFACAVVEP